jgi:hypothetical protein
MKKLFAKAISTAFSTALLAIMESATELNGNRVQFKVVLKLSTQTLLLSLYALSLISIFHLFKKTLSSKFIPLTSFSTNLNDKEKLKFYPEEGASCFSILDLLRQTNLPADREALDI